MHVLYMVPQAIAFDKRTSALHYLVSIIAKNDNDILRISEEFMPVRAAKRFVFAAVSDQLADLTNGMELVNKMAKKCSQLNCENNTAAGTGIATELEQFAKNTELRVRQAADGFNEASSNFANLLGFFGEENTIKPEAFFSTINKFVNMVDETSKEISRSEVGMVSFASSPVNDCSIVLY